MQDGTHARIGARGAHGSQVVITGTVEYHIQWPGVHTLACATGRNTMCGGCFRWARSSHNGKVVEIMMVVVCFASARLPLVWIALGWVLRMVGMVMWGTAACLVVLRGRHALAMVCRPERVLVGLVQRDPVHQHCRMCWCHHQHLCSQLWQLQLHSCAAPWLICPAWNAQA
jgi:hypothetical protein